VDDQGPATLPPRPGPGAFLGLCPGGRPSRGSVWVRACGAVLRADRATPCRWPLLPAWLRRAWPRHAAPL